ncbi:hypothetical protein KAFR_0A05120 [Kazachstania africana CBS 2517]|uniref:Histone deacetylase interacting domain-containing protein n=1 Tax=Kazachstania africana (strain ATCC 22294 / BCRC 22015 / CBS 2517 / CECT 1963 / NBRC 1671 / NRRL Y-8276) TaxID=1071382 RepID=H2ANJ7_KAZAF|nr:hypothetical protein KAFR_0A05120 [Kazachstania africana CBS 2517]CCF55947.1 hypothetical protein KAFR_0A05120 [Kazachstania africana CBS 2517]
MNQGNSSTNIPQGTATNNPASAASTSSVTPPVAPGSQHQLASIQAPTTIVNANTIPPSHVNTGENKNAVVLPSLSTLNNSTEQKEQQEQQHFNPLNILNTNGSNRKNSTMDSIMNPEPPTSMVSKASTTNTQTTPSSSSVPPINNGNVKVKNERAPFFGTGVSVASFDNPLPPLNQQQSQPSFPAMHMRDQQQQQQMAAAPAAAEDDASYRPLNVKDALSYLEQVKQQFNSRPDIYNQFLDIMKDFKSQTIDTPGVIERVSTLFRGYPSLIQGFNTFLPTGYRIDCPSNPNDPIKVTTPIGSSTLHEMTRSVQRANSNLQQQQALSQNNMMQQAQIPIGSISNNANLNAAVQSVDDQAKQANKKPADVEFSQAINYVNKIKNRFADQPDIYKNFLEILQTYQREQKPINEVYAQVTILFQNAPDLLDDFKKFLPDSSKEQQYTGQLPQQIPNQEQLEEFSGSYARPPNAPLDMVAQQSLPPIGSFSPPANTGISMHDQSQRPHMMALPSMLQHEQIIDMNNHPKPAVSTQGISNDEIPVSDVRMAQYPNGAVPDYGQYPTHPQMKPDLATQRHILQQQEIQQQQLMLQQQQEQELLEQQQQQYVEAPVRPEIDLDPSIVPVVPEPTEPIESNFTLIEETSFFDKAKKFINNKQIYTEFLKVLNLFSQDLISVDDLVNKVEYYIGSSKELFEWFRNFVGYQGNPKIIENIVHEKHRLDLDLCEACGPSYKRLPKSDTFMPCSGRDDMCWEVLNDEWVGHPVWASEDSGFIAHRKNQYEETLFKIEEERHEYDYYIESNLRTIQTLEAIVNKISNMSEEEKKNFKLEPGLGHTSLTIYKKVIRKVYDKERGFEIIDALHEHPAIAAPIVLKRLKQKDEEWRRAQREWNKVWRELEQKVYFKSLDHLGLTFKQADKKLLTIKQLISEISSIKVDQNNKRIHWLTPKPKSQLNFDIKDFEILFDILSLSENFINHSSTYSTSDKERLNDFLKSFISLFFSVPLNEINNALDKRNNQKNSEKVTDSALPDGTENQKKRSIHDIELSMSDILHRTKYQKMKLSNRGSDSQEENNIDTIIDEESDERLAEEADLIRQDAKRPWLLGDIIDKTNTQGIITDRKKFNLFANTNIYVFLRHWTTLYERLLELKEMNGEVTKEINNRKSVKFAEDLGLVSTQLKNMGLDFVDKDSYEELLRLSKRLIENDIEHQWFEESLRQAYNNRAFKLYTVDKVVQALVKHGHTLMTDYKTTEVMKLFEKDRLSSATSAKDQILYRLQARSHMSNTEYMFRIEYNKDDRNICIQYIALDDLTLKEGNTEEEKWKYYVTSYSLPHPTEGIDHESLQIPFLQKILEFDQEELENNDEENKSNGKYSPEGVSNSMYKIKIHPGNYALDIQTGSFDIFSRKSLNKYPVKVNEDHESLKLNKKKNILNTFLESNNGWKKHLKKQLSLKKNESEPESAETRTIPAVPASTTDKPPSMEQSTGI